MKGCLWDGMSDYISEGQTLISPGWTDVYKKNDINRVCLLSQQLQCLYVYLTILDANYEKESIDIKLL
jgi:hypothetical protein